MLSRPPSTRLTPLSLKLSIPDIALQVQPLRLSKSSTMASPAKDRSALPRPLSELSPTEKRRNSPSWNQTTKVRRSLPSASRESRTDRLSYPAPEDDTHRLVTIPVVPLGEHHHVPAHVLAEPQLQLGKQPPGSLRLADSVPPILH
jgi:hypothetical protein